MGCDFTNQNFPVPTDGGFPNWRVLPKFKPKKLLTQIATQIVTQNSLTHNFSTKISAIRATKTITYFEPLYGSFVDENSSAWQFVFIGPPQLCWW